MLVITFLSVALQTGAAVSAPADIWSEIDPKRVCSGSSVWHLGIQGSTPHTMAETISATMVKGRSVWRISHTDAEKGADGSAPAPVLDQYDRYDLDARSLYPIESENRSKDGQGGIQRLTRFVYEVGLDRARRLDENGAAVEVVPLAGQRPFPEGPGSAVLYQTIEWRDGLRMRGYVVDRWRGEGAARLRQVEFAVIGRGTLVVQGFSIPTFIISEAPHDGSYRITNHVTVEPPHQIVRVEYTNGSLPTFVSEVRQYGHDADCTANVRRDSSRR